MSGPVARLVASVLGVGFLRPGPGTWGSLAALLLAFPILSLGGPWLLALLTALAWGVGLAAARSVIARGGDHDPGWVVIDEVAGQWIALGPVAYGAARMDAPLLALWPGWVAAFLLFRFFDIRKPWLVGRADRRGDAFGLMMDDMWAGLFAAVGVIVLAALFHGFLMR